MADLKQNIKFFSIRSDIDYVYVPARMAHPGSCSLPRQGSAELILWKVVVRCQTQDLKDQPAIRDEMDELLSDLESLMQQTAIEAESYHKAAESAQAQALLHLRRASARASSLDMLIDDISELLPALNMDAFYLTLHERDDPHRARLVLANESGRRIPLRAGGLEFEPRTLVPPSLRRRGDVATSVAQPLQYGGVRLGFVVMRGNLYDAQLLGDVCQIVSMALSRLEAHSGE